ncbi:maleylacetoacetate isomerase [Rhodopseudomonas sp. P2A-2r]|uniref:maleylacetoacetate isomerase n=1 Tax=unclassified Rhodopseudomonas TaxID=2638247 RepID=UPI002234C0A2|nr:maleylacetoacetate isomerase [Rhodopseudomonas sp. P2A-2r]UZE49618.1 maleylacetoacetate isomerase [Rhodopseudomonas sp. P2A-2r]
MTDTPDFELYGFWRTSATYRVRVALNLKGLVAHEHVIDLDKGEQLSPAFLKINPMGAIPALVTPGHPPLTESLAILEFLDETHPAPPLLPADPHGRARVRSIAQMLAGDTHPLITPRVRKYLAGTGGFDDAAVRAWIVHWFTVGLAAVETRLAGEAATGTFCHGDQVTMADICLASITAVMRALGITVQDIPTIGAIVARCEALEAFAKADPMKQIGAPV